MSDTARGLDTTAQVRQACHDPIMAQDSRKAEAVDPVRVSRRDLRALPAGVYNPKRAVNADGSPSPWGTAVDNYVQMRMHHARTELIAGSGYWGAQVGAVVLAGVTPLLVLFSKYPDLVKAIPASIAAVLAAFNGLLDWRSLANARRNAVNDMDREFRRFDQHRQRYADMADEVAARLFSDQIERINDLAEKATWLGSGPPGAASFELSGPTPGHRGPD
jgi:hypothetical protein